MYQPLIDVNLIANHIRDLLCFDISIEKMERLTYAKELIKITPDKLLLDYILVPLSYDWLAYVDFFYP